MSRLGSRRRVEPSNLVLDGQSTATCAATNVSARRLLFRRIRCGGWGLGPAALAGPFTESLVLCARSFSDDAGSVEDLEVGCSVPRGDVGGQEVGGLQKGGRVVDERGELDAAKADRAWTLAAPELGADPAVTVVSGFDLEYGVVIEVDADGEVSVAAGADVDGVTSKQIEVVDDGLGDS